MVQRLERKKSHFPRTRWLFEVRLLAYCFSGSSSLLSGRISRSPARMKSNLEFEFYRSFSASVGRLEDRLEHVRCESGYDMILKTGIA